MQFDGPVLDRRQPPGRSRRAGGAVAVRRRRRRGDATRRRPTTSRPRSSQPRPPPPSAPPPPPTCARRPSTTSQAAGRGSEEIAALITAGIRQAADVGAAGGRPGRCRRSGGVPEEARRWSGTLQRLDTDPAASGRMALVRRAPRGPVLGIAPFNFPLNLVAHKVAPAIAVGAPIVLKPAPATPLSALLLGEILAETDLPAGAWSVLPVPNEVAAEMVRDPRLPVVSFTGSVPVGWAIRTPSRASTSPSSWAATPLWSSPRTRTTPRSPTRLRASPRSRCSRRGSRASPCSGSSPTATSQGRWPSAWSRRCRSWSPATRGTAPPTWDR